ncbi:hypothetical protein LOAG_02321 [Loa loa]|uniref:Uncharacterized protein n=1 Tax=Loa loa TaxID=7209 RepID=A0A1S0U7A7_LOALO|nr:hypothetical protein LOAG_02321 [Loa loa]EFO26163.1 hypothetical protein LOAG_02321 [Loa loa]
MRNDYLCGIRPDFPHMTPFVHVSSHTFPDLITGLWPAGNPAAWIPLVRLSMLLNGACNHLLGSLAVNCAKHAEVMFKIKGLPMWVNSTRKSIISSRASG